jgi:hypothetical protein
MSLLRWALVTLLVLACRAAAAEPPDAVVVGGPEGRAEATAIAIGDVGDGQPVQMTMTIHAAPADDGPPPRLGLSVAPADAAIAAQLKLPAGTGLAVQTVSPDSPAAVAGIRPHDVLIRLEDQLLVNVPQLAALVALRQPGEKVVLTLRRDGRELAVTVALPAADKPVAAPAPPAQPVPAEQGAAQAPPGPAAAPPAAGGIIQVGPMVAMQGGGFAVASSVFSDGRHTLHLTTRGGRKTLLAQDGAGQVVFSGPIDTEEQRAKVPPEVLAKADAASRRPQFGAVDIHALRRFGRNVPEAPFVPAEKGPAALGARVTVTMEEDGLTLTLAADDEGQTLRVLDKKGEVVFDGPVATEEDRKKVPEKVQPKLERLAAACGAVFFGK